jgi:hypothetical protein
MARQTNPFRFVRWSSAGSALARGDTRVSWRGRLLFLVWATPGFAATVSAAQFDGRSAPSMALFYGGMLAMAVGIAGPLVHTHWTPSLRKKPADRAWGDGGQPRSGGTVALVTGLGFTAVFLAGAVVFVVLATTRSLANLVPAAFFLLAAGLHLALTLARRRTTHPTRSAI